MKKSTKLLGLLVVIALVILVAATAAPVLAGNTISCTVTPRQISLTVSPDTWNVGTLNMGGSAVTTATATNTGTDTETVLVNGTNATSSLNPLWTWALADLGVLPGLDVYALDYQSFGMGPFYQITTTPSLVKNPDGTTAYVPAGASGPVTGRLRMPTATTHGGNYSMQIVLTAAGS